MNGPKLFFIIVSAILAAVAILGFCVFGSCGAIVGAGMNAQLEGEAQAKAIIDEQQQRLDSCRLTIMNVVRANFDVMLTVRLKNDGDEPISVVRAKIELDSLEAKPPIFEPIIWDKESIAPGSEAQTLVTVRLPMKYEISATSFSIVPTLVQ